MIIFTIKPALPTIQYAMAENKGIGINLRGIKSPMIFEKKYEDTR